MPQQMSPFLHWKVIGNSHSLFWLQCTPYRSHHLAFWNIAAEDTNEEDTQEVTSQTSPMFQVTYLSIYHPFDTILTFVFSIQIHCLPSKRARIAPSLVTGSGNTITFPLWSNLAYDINLIIQQTSIIIQESPVIPQDALLESGIRALLLASSSATTTDEVPLIQVRHPFIFLETKKGNIQLTFLSS